MNRISLTHLPTMPLFSGDILLSEMKGGKNEKK
jgi:hypothetical protein